MSNRAFLWTGLGLLAAGAVGWGIAGRGGAPAADDGTVPEAVEEARAAAGLAAHPAAAGATPAPVTILPRGVTGPLLVRVTAAYEPKAGVSVRVRRMDTLHPRAAVATDARGLARLPAVDRGVDVVEAIAEGFRPTSTEREGFQETDGALELTLEPGTPVAGRVVDATTGEGVDGASVVVRLASYPYEIGVVGPSGRFTIPGLWDGADAEVAATAPGHAPARASVALAAGGGPPPEPVLRMGFGGAFVGVVRTADGAPVSGAEVALFQRAPPRAETARTSDGRPFADSVDRYFGDDVWTPVEAPDAASGPTRSNGAFRVDGLEPGTDYEVVARGAGLVPEEATWIRTSAAGDAGPAALVVLRAATVHLRVPAPADDPLPDHARVRLFHGDAMSSPAGAAIHGEFLFQNVRPGPVAAVAQAYGFEPALLRATVAEGEETQLTLVVRPVPGVSGVAVDAAGRPLAGAEVRAIPAGSQGQSEARVFTDRRGRFDIRHPPAAEVDLTASRHSQTVQSQVTRTREAVRVRAPASDVRIVLLSRGVIRLRAPRTDGAWAMIARADRLYGIGYLLALADGAFEQGDLDDGTYEVIVFAPGFAWERREVAIEEGGTVDLGEVSLPVGVSVSGRILETDGRPVEHAQVKPALFEQFSGPRPLPGDAERSTLTDAKGAFTLEHLPAGAKVMITASAPDHSPREGEAVAGSATSLELRLPRLARLVGDLRGPEGTDLEGVDVVLHRDAGRALRGGVVVDLEENVSLEPNESGEFRHSLTPGVWTAVFTDRAGEDHVLGTWTLGEGAEVVDVVLRLPGS